MADSNTPTSSDATKLISLTNLETYTGYIERKSVPVTREQYTALPSTKLTDGISYFITDEGIIIKNGVSYGDPTSSDTTYSLSVGTGDDANKIILTPSSGTPDKVTVPYATTAGSANNATTVNNHTVASDVPADAVFTDNNTTYGLSVGTGDDANKIVLTPSTGTANKITVPYASNAGTVNGHSVAVDVPSDAEFTDTTYEEATTSTAGLLSSSDKTKLNNLGTAASKNVPTSGNASTTEVVMGNDTRLSDSRNAADVYSWAKAETKPTYTASEVGAIATTAKGANNGVAELDSTGKVPSSQLPSYVDDVLEYDSLSDFPLTGESGKIYIAKDTNKTYRWSGTTYVKIGSDLALGETSSTAYRGDRGKIAYDHSQVTSGNPHNVTKSEVGLGNVTNDKQIVGLASGTTEDHVVTFGTDGYSVKDSGKTLGTSVPSDAVFTDTTYSAASNSGITLNANTNEFSNSGVRSVAQGSTNGTVSVNTNGTTVDVAVKGLGSAAYTSSTDYVTPGSETYFTHIGIGSDSSANPLIYTENNHINFRWGSSYQYTNVDYLCTNAKKVDNSANWLPSNGWNPFTQSDGYFCYSCNPGLKPAQGLPSGLSEYCTIFGSILPEYDFLMCIDIYGRIAMYNKYESKWDNMLMAGSVSGHTLNISM